VERSALLRKQPRIKQPRIKQPRREDFVEKPFREEIISKERRAPGRIRLALNCSRTVYNLLIWLNYFL
jgi:hypothetical protein